MSFSGFYVGFRKQNILHSVKGMILHFIITSFIFYENVIKQYYFISESCLNISSECNICIHVGMCIMSYLRYIVIIIISGCIYYVLYLVVFSHYLRTLIRKYLQLERIIQRIWWCKIVRKIYSRLTPKIR